MVGLDDDHIEEPGEVGAVLGDAAARTIGVTTPMVVEHDRALAVISSWSPNIEGQTLLVGRGFVEAVGRIGALVGGMAKAQGVADARPGRRGAPGRENAGRRRPCPP